MVEGDSKKLKRDQERGTGKETRKAGGKVPLDKEKGDGEGTKKPSGEGMWKRKTKGSGTKITPKTNRKK